MIFNKHTVLHEVAALFCTPIPSVACKEYPNVHMYLNMYLNHTYTIIIWLHLARQLYFRGQCLIYSEVPLKAHALESCGYHRFPPETPTNQKEADEEAFLGSRSLLSFSSPQLFSLLQWKKEGIRSSTGDTNSLIFVDLHQLKDYLQELF